MHTNPTVQWALAGLALTLLWKLLRKYVVKSPLDLIPGPPSESWLLGNLNQIFKSEDEIACDKWVSKYGPTMMYREFFNVST